MKTRFGPARVPSRESPEAAIDLLLERGYSACEIDFEGGFWMKPEWEWAGRFGELAKKNKIALSIHAPIAAILGSQDVEAWIIGIVVSGLSVILTAIVWSARG